MFDWLKNLGPEADGLNKIHREFVQMIEDGRHVFDAAANALLGGTDPSVIREDLYTTDQRINATERQIRREIVVHGSVHGASTFPALLVMMSLVKDAERIGDYAKNLFELVVLEADLGDDAQRQPLIEMKDRVSHLLVRARNIYVEQDQKDARKFLTDVDALQTECDDGVEAFLKEDGVNRGAQVLTYRYFKRVASHIGNVITSVVMPIDRLDYVDEPRER